MTVVEFREWLSRLPLEGTRGFIVADIMRVYGEGHLEQLSKYVKKGWIESRRNTTVWWISDTGKLALQGGLD